jgi:hypothetical protein
MSKDGNSFEGVSTSKSLRATALHQLRSRDGFSMRTWPSSFPKAPDFLECLKCELVRDMRSTRSSRLRKIQFFFRAGDV